MTVAAIVRKAEMGSAGRPRVWRELLFLLPRPLLLTLTLLECSGRRQSLTTTDLFLLGMMRMGVVRVVRSFSWTREFGRRGPILISISVPFSVISNRPIFLDIHLSFSIRRTINSIKNHLIHAHILILITPTISSIPIGFLRVTILGVLRPILVCTIGRSVPGR